MKPSSSSEKSFHSSPSFLTSSPKSSPAPTPSPPTLDSSGDTELLDQSTIDHQAKKCDFNISSKILDIIQPNLKCAICQDIYINPLILNCSHSFCKFCVYRWLTKHKDCPHCRMTVTFQSENLALRNVIDCIIQNSSPQFQEYRKVSVEQRLKDEEAQDKENKTNNPKGIPTWLYNLSHLNQPDILRISLNTISGNTREESDDSPEDFDESEGGEWMDEMMDEWGTSYLERETDSDRNDDGDDTFEIDPEELESLSDSDLNDDVEEDEEMDAPDVTGDTDEGDDDDDDDYEIEGDSDSSDDDGPIRIRRRRFYMQSDSEEDTDIDHSNRIRDEDDSSSSSSCSDGNSSSSSDDDDDCIPTRRRNIRVLSSSSSNDGVASATISDASDLSDNDDWSDGDRLMS